MKKIYSLILLSAILHQTKANAQSNCDAGYETPIFTNTMLIPANYAFAIKVTAASAGTLTDICAWNAGLSTLNMKMAVYDDNSGVPGNLIASTASFNVTSTSGVLTEPVTPVAIVPGNYYLVGIIDANGSPITIDNTTGATVFQMPLIFSNSFPPTGGSFSTTTGHPVNIWMKITCSTSGINEVIGSGNLIMDTYPNPVYDNYTLALNASMPMNLSIMIYDANGQVVNKVDEKILAGETKVDLSLNGFAPGIYLLRVVDESQQVMIARRMIKEK